MPPLEQLYGRALLTFAEAERSPLSVRAKALVFADPRSQALAAECAQRAPGTQPLLICGELGTGRELLARHIHSLSARSGLFVALNCASLSPDNAEAELFGHVAGHYNASASSRAGWFGSAHGGSLYLDEVADLPRPLQTRLAQAIRCGEVVRVGASVPSPASVRLIAATGIDLQLAVAAGKFDPELHALLAARPLELPPLREHPADIPLLVEHFLHSHAERLGLPVPPLSAEASASLLAYRWPGNIRELEHIICRALLTCGAQIEPCHLALPASG